MKKILRIAISGLALAGAVAVTSITQAATIVVSTSNNALNFVDTDTVSVTNTVSVSGVSGFLTDIAYDQNGNLYGVTFQGLYSINTNTGTASHIGNFGGVSTINALTFDSAGNAYAAGYANSNLYSIDVNTGGATSIGAIGGGFTGSAGDLAFAGSDLFGVDEINPDRLFAIDETTGAGSAIGSSGLNSLYGLAYADGTMFGFHGNLTDLYTINLATGLALSLGTIAGLTDNYELTGATAMVSVIPLPAALPMFGAALAGLALMRRFKKSA